VDGTKTPSFLEAFAARLGAGAGGGRGVVARRDDTAGGPGSISPTSDRRLRVGAPTRREGSCYCYGKRAVPGMRKPR
jgi:hypothetical protein